jgi:hypothetical protein
MVFNHSKNESDKSDNEKMSGRPSNSVSPVDSDLPADPDAHLSAAERAAIVSLELDHWFGIANHCSGSQTCLEARPVSNPLGEFE